VHNPVPMSGPRIAARITAALALALVSLAGCGGTENRPATWSYISTAIIEPSCATASCHSQAADRAGVDLSDRGKAYDQLVNRHFVMPGNAPQSELSALLTAEGVRRMPPDFPLPAADIQLIAEWINAGAKND
jgi:hypothetical protein